MFYCTIESRREDVIIVSLSGERQSGALELEVKLAHLGSRMKNIYT